MIRSEVPGWALGCHSFVQSFFSLGRDGRRRADGVFSLCRGKPEATKEHPDLFGHRFRSGCFLLAWDSMGRGSQESVEWCLEGGTGEGASGRLPPWRLRKSVPGGGREGKGLEGKVDK